MRLVFIESPSAVSVQRNIIYARRALADSIIRGEAPFASHLLYTQEGILDDTDVTQRQLGIKIGFEWARFANLTAVYADYGITRGMDEGIVNAKKHNRSVELRFIGFNP